MLLSKKFFQNQYLKFLKDKKLKILKEDNLIESYISSSEIIWISIFIWHSTSSWILFQLLKHNSMPNFSIYPVNN